MIITLLSDLGMRDAAVPATKATLMQHVPAATVVDVSHCVARDDTRQAAYLLLSAYKSFEKGTIHIVLVDVFCGEIPRMLLAKKDGHFFIAPDNGILPLALGTPEVVRECFVYSKPYSFNEWMENAATVAATLEQGWVVPYPKTEIQAIPWPSSHQPTPYGIECSVLYIDRYKNVVLNILKKQFEQLAADRSFTIRTRDGKEITAISHNYNDVDPEQPLCRFNSAGYMEIAVNRGDAASLLGLDMAMPGDMKYKVVRIFF